MYFVTLTYKVPLEQIDQHLEAHKAWLNSQYERGSLLASGAREPRNGGVLMVQDMDQELLEEMIYSDPFSRADLADYEWVRWLPNRTAPGLDKLKEY